MNYGKSITFDEEDLKNAAAAASEAACSTPEKEFLDDLQAGSVRAFEILITRYSPDIYALLFRMTQSSEEAADLTQETFLKAFRSIGRFRGDSELKTWLYRIAINESRNRVRWWRRRKREQTVSLDDRVGNSDLLVYQTLRDASETPEDSMIASENRHRLEAALRDMPSAFREVLVLCDIEGQSYQEIAATLGMNIGTVKSRIARGRDELRRKLKDV